MIRLAWPAFGPEVEELVLGVLRSGQVAQGPMVERLEQLAAAMAGTTRAVAVCNGTAALETALELVGVGPGDEVITSPLTFPATLNAILRAGATARFADVGPDLTLDPGAAAGLVGPRTKVLLPVHLFGLPADMEALGRLAGKHGLTVVEDACQAHGARCGGRAVGGFGIGCFSLYPTKNVAGGEGGLLTTSDEGVAGRARLLRNQGFAGADRSPRLVGRNLRLTDVQAAMAIPHLEALEATNRARRANAAVLDGLLRDMPGIERPAVPPGRIPVWQQYTVLLPEGCDRAALQACMAGVGVETAVHYRRLVWDHGAYRGHPGVAADPTPAAAAVVDRWLCLPVHQRLAGDDLERVAAALTAALACGGPPGGRTLT